jgi:chemotaxis family two-component system response regulator Rcp1
MNERVLLSVEDSDADFYLIQTALKLGEVAVQICRVCDGEEAIAFLERTGDFRGAPRPQLILLNVHMPRKDGFEVLDYLRTHDNFRSIPTVMFTTLSDARDRTHALALGAKDFLVKHNDLATLLHELAATCARYLNPPRSSAAGVSGQLGGAASAEG